MVRKTSKFRLQYHIDLKIVMVMLTINYSADNVFQFVDK